MAKFKTIGHIAKSKKDPKKSYICLEETVTASRDKKTYLQLFEPRKSDKQTDDDFAQLLSWKRFDVVQVIEE